MHLFGKKTIHSVFGFRAFYFFVCLCPSFPYGFGGGMRDLMI